jgi:hypothetical protein
LARNNSGTRMATAMIQPSAPGYVLCFSMLNCTDRCCWGFSDS